MEKGGSVVQDLNSVEKRFSIPQSGLVFEERKKSDIYETGRLRESPSFKGIKKDITLGSGSPVPHSSGTPLPTKQIPVTSATPLPGKMPPQSSTASIPNKQPPQSSATPMPGK